MSISFSDLGITSEELTDRIVDQAVSQLLEHTAWDPDGDEHTSPSELGKRLQATVRERLDAQFDEFAQSVIQPSVEQMLERMVFPSTNRYGEPKAPPQTLREHLAARADAWLGEEVDREGRSFEEARRQGRGWDKSTKRIQWVISQHLDAELRAAFNKIMASATGELLRAIEATAKERLASIASTLKLQATL